MLVVVYIVQSKRGLSEASDKLIDLLEKTINALEDKLKTAEASDVLKSKQLAERDEIITRQREKIATLNETVAQQTIQLNRLRKGGN